MRPVISREMRDINRTCILEYMRVRGKVSRTAIAKDLGLSLSSVVRITDELMEERLICLQGEYEFSGGRRRPLIELDAQLNVVISIVVGGQKAMAALCSITGQILESHVLKDHHAKGEACVELIRSLASDMYAHASGKIVRGISVGVPGIVLNGNKVMAAPTVGLDNVCLAERLSPFFDCPILVENDVNLEALGESWFGCEQSASNLVYIHIGTLLGMGIVQDRCIFRGAHHGAGELLQGDRQGLGAARRRHGGGVLVAQRSVNRSEVQHADRKARRAQPGRPPARARARRHKKRSRRNESVQGVLPEREHEQQRSGQGERTPRPREETLRIAHRLA